MSDLENPVTDTAPEASVSPEVSATPEVAVEAPVVDSWTSTLPEDLKGSPTLAKAKDLNSALKNYVELEKSMGNKIKVPGEDATPEELNSFYNKIGRPETKEGYGFEELLKDKAELFTVAPQLKESIDAFATMAHELGMPKAAAEKLLNWQTEKLETQIQEMATKTEQAKESLAKIWGDNTEAKLAEANAASDILAKQYPDEMQVFKDSDAARNPVTMIMLSELATLYKEKNDGVLGGESVQQNTPQNRLKELMSAGRDHPLWNDRHPEHRSAVKEYNSLYEEVGNSRT